MELGALAVDPSRPRRALAATLFGPHTMLAGRDSRPCTMRGPAQEYARLLAEDGLSLETSVHGTAGFSLAGQTGAYRLVLASPTNLEWELLRHSRQDTNLADGEGVEPDGALLALRLGFSLEPSSYATMVVRELTKQSGAALHAALPKAGAPV